MTRVKSIKGDFYVQKKIFCIGKKQFNQKTKGKHEAGNNRDMKRKFRTCNYCKRTTHLEKHKFNNCK